MKSLVSMIILSVVLAGVPSKVWACGLNLCEMEHSKAQKEGQRKPSCHETNHETNHETRAEAKNTETEGGSVKAVAEICPCPSGTPMFSLIRSEKLDRFNIEGPRVDFDSFSIRLSLLENESDWSRPPPFLEKTLSGLLFLDFQIFII